MYVNKIEAQPPPPPRHYNPPPLARRPTNPYDVDETRSNHVKFPGEYYSYRYGAPPRPSTEYAGHGPRGRSPTPPPPSTYSRPAAGRTNYTRPSTRRTHHTVTHTRYTSPVRERDRRDLSPASPTYSPAYSPTSPVLAPAHPRQSSIEYIRVPEYPVEQRKTEFIVEKRRDAASSAEEAEWDYKRPPRRKRTRDERDDGNMDEEDLVLMGMWETDAAFESGPTRNPVATGPYSFVPPSASKDPLRDVGKLSDNDSLDTTEQDIEAAERLTGTAYEVLESGYTGDGMIGGQHGAQLVITPGECVQHQPVFRWIHFSHKSMDFDNFATTRLLGLTKSERQGVADLIARVKRQSIKQIQTSNGSYVRHMEPKFLQMPVPFDPSLKEQSFANRTVTWICLPYFSLEKYSGLLAAENASSFPVQTLLQAQFSRATKDRDMQQAVRQLKGAPAELCFHIAQLWCIVVDNSLLLTCGRMPFDALCGNIIHRVTKTAQEISTLKPTARVFIRYQNNIVWALPIEECGSWFSFMAHFLEFWPRTLNFFYYKRPVKPDEWPWITKLASRSRAGILLEMQIGHKPALPSPMGLSSLKREERDDEVQFSASKQPDDSSQRKTVRITIPREGKETAESKSNSAFAVFTCLDGVSNSGRGGINHDVFKDYFVQVDKYLLNKTARQDQKAYSELRQSKRRDVYKLLEEEGGKGKEESPPSEREKTMYESRVSFFNKADIVFKFFFPSELEVPTVDRFWGIVLSLIEHPTLEPDDPAEPRSKEINKAKRSLQMEKLARQRNVVTKTLDRQIAALSSFNATFSAASPTDLKKVHTPWLLVDAWIHILLGLAISPKNTTRSEFLLDSGLSSLRQGTDTMIQSVANSFERTLFDRSVILPTDLFSLISMQLLKDITPALPDISETYSSYLDTIESDITTKPSTRTHEYKLGRLKQEVSIVQWTVAWQRSIFDAMSQSSTRNWSMQPRHPHAHASHRGMYTYTQLPSPDITVSTHGYRQLLIDEIISFTDRRDKEFSELRSHASHLEEFNRNKLDTTRDRQERAIYAFTIVTIVFLPLSSIASIFGMNSADVRDMEVGQWAYWVTAVPVTVGVVLMGLWWTGEMGGVIRTGMEWVRGWGEGGRWREREEDMVPMMGGYEGGGERAGWREKGGYVVGGVRKRR
ncbi:Putative protein of unknown function [Podospora comata]|uniref:Uncharacterized protein n=1 Tax=Podospora comata TaxID=48703 RepID=A0ABY6S9S7_PODCO|nr:Putative protein of unknown function [Podospora comata]